MVTSEIILSILAGVFALAFGLWAKRLDKALDVLESLQDAWFKHALAMEKRVTRVETHIGLYHFGENDDS